MVKEERMSKVLTPLLGSGWGVKEGEHALASIIIAYSSSLGGTRGGF